MKYHWFEYSFDWNIELIESNYSDNKTYYILYSYQPVFLINPGSVK